MVDRQVSARVVGIAQQLASFVAGMTPKQLYPFAFRTVDPFELRTELRFDFEFPNCREHGIRHGADCSANFQAQSDRLLFHFNLIVDAIVVILADDMP